MKILFISPFFYPHRGGSELYAEELLAQTKQSYPHVKIDVLTYKSDKSQTHEHYRELRIFRVGCATLVGKQFLIPNPFSLIARLWKQKDEQYDIIFTQTRFFDATWWAWIYAKIVGAKSVFIGHGTNYVSHPNKLVVLISRVIDHTLAKWSVCRYTHRVVISRSTQQFYANQLGITDTTLIHGAIHTHKYSRTAEPLELKLIPNTTRTLMQKTLVVSYVGRLIHAKGVMELIDSFRRLLEQHPTLDIHLIVAGTGVLEPTIKEHIETENLAEKVTLTGNLTPNQVEELLALSDIFVNPSHNEGLPRTVIEAAAAGNVVIASDVGSTNEIIIHNRTGVLIPPNNEVVLTSTLNHVITHFHNYRKLGIKAQFHAQNHFDWSIIANRFYQLILFPVEKLHSTVTRRVGFVLNFIYLVQGAAYALIIMGVFGLSSIIYPIVSSELSYEIKSQLTEQGIVIAAADIAEPRTHFSNLINETPPLGIVPVNTTNSIMIEKINVNVPVVWDTSVIDQNDYLSALNNGVAHAAGTTRPTTENGNTYLFAHSTLNPLEIERYAASFTLLHRLEAGDRIVVFSDNKRYDYEIETLEVVDGFNTEPLTRQPEYSMLTLQTCDPPGIPLNRMIVTSKLIGVYDLDQTI